MSSHENGNVGSVETAGSLSDEQLGSGLQINEFINLNIAQIAPDFSGFLQSIQTIDNENVTISIGAALPSGYALNTAAPIALTPDNWHEPVSGPSETRNEDGGGYDATAETDAQNALLEGFRVGDAGVLPADIAARTVGTIAPTTPAVASTNAVTQIAPSSFAAAARPAQATRPGRAGNIDQQQNAKVFDQLTNSLVITSVAIAPAIALPSLANAETNAPNLTDSGAETEAAAQEARDADTTRSLRAQAETPALRADAAEPTREDIAPPPQSETPNEAQDTPPQSQEATPQADASSAAPSEAGDAASLPREAVGAQPEDVQPANRAPTIAPLSDAKSEEDAAYQIHLLTGGADAEGDVFYIDNADITATDENGATISLPAGAATITGNVLNLDPMAFDALNSDQTVTLSVAYDVTDGIGATATTATITINGFTDPFLTVPAAETLSLTENQSGDLTAISLGQVQADGHEMLSYQFANGSPAHGDFRIDPASGVISYVGSGIDYESYAAVGTSNIAQGAVLSTTVPSFFNFTVEEALANMVDGNLSTAGIDDYSVHPQNADGETITFDFDANYTDPTFVFHSRTWHRAVSRIDDSTIDYKYQGQTVHTETLDSATHDNYVITLESPDTFTFDQVVLTFDGATQNFREVEIMARRAPIERLYVNVTSGELTETTLVDVGIANINEAPSSSAIIATQYVSKGTTWSLVPPEGVLVDPEGAALNYTASLQDGSPLPSFLTINGATGEISTQNANASGLYTIRLTADDGSNSAFIDFDLVVSSNAMPQTTLSTSVTSWADGDEASNLAAISDGDLSTAGALDRAVQPDNADGQSITFTLNAVYSGGQFIFHNSTQSGADDIDGSLVRFFRNGALVHSAALQNSDAENGRIIISPETSIEFDEITLTFAGNTQGFREVEIFGMPKIDWASASAFTFNENSGAGETVATLSASADTPVSYSFQNGSQTSGNFSIDATTGIITYLGSAFDYEGGARSNLAPVAELSTDVPAFHSYTVAEALANMVDGETTTSGALNYSVHPTQADGRHITFDFSESYLAPEFKFYNRAGAGQNRIDDSVLSFRHEGVETASVTLNHSTQVNHVITHTFAANVIFDQVVLTFSGASQNFREIEIFGSQLVTETVTVRASAGGVTSDLPIVIAIGDVNEAPVSATPPTNQVLDEGATLTYGLPIDLFTDAEGDAISYTADLGNNTPLPDWISFDTATAEFTFAPQNGDDGQTDIFVYASDGALTGLTDFTVEVNDVL